MSAPLKPLKPRDVGSVPGIPRTRLQKRIFLAAFTGKLDAAVRVGTECPPYGLRKLQASERKALQKLRRRQALAARLLQLQQTQSAFAASDDDALFIA